MEHNINALSIKEAQAQLKQLEEWTGISISYGTDIQRKLKDKFIAHWQSLHHNLDLKALSWSSNDHIRKALDQADTYAEVAAILNRKYPDPKAERIAQLVEQVRLKLDTILPKDKPKYANDIYWAKEHMSRTQLSDALRRASEGALPLNCYGITESYSGRSNWFANLQELLKLTVELDLKLPERWGNGIEEYQTILNQLNDKAVFKLFKNGRVDIELSSPEHEDFAELLTNFWLRIYDAQK